MLSLSRFLLFLIGITLIVHAAPIESASEVITVNDTPYTVQHFLGHGKSGEAYLVQDTEGQEWTLKRLFKKSKDADYHRERLALERLGRLHDCEFNLEEDKRILVFTYTGGHRMDWPLHEAKMEGTEEAIEKQRALYLAALSKFHQKANMKHGDPHPGNFMKISPEEVMAIDFGEAIDVSDMDDEQKKEAFDSELHTASRIIDWYLNDQYDV